MELNHLFVFLFIVAATLFTYTIVCISELQKQIVELKNKEQK
jgi:hypothetical protein